MYGNDDLNYVYGRLVGTIIRHGDKAVTVLDVLKGRRPDSPFLIKSEHCITGERIYGELTEFNLVPVELGFVNYPSHAISSYYVRIPTRGDYRQGLRSQNCRRVTGQVPFEARAIAATIENIFPKFEMAQDMIKKMGKKHNIPMSVAWTRHFAVDQHNNIIYRGFGAVGKFIGRGRDYMLNNGYTWVEEELVGDLK